MAKRNIALFMGLNDYYEHGIARGVVRFAKRMPSWSLFGYGWMFRPLDALDSWDGDGIIARVESQRDAERLSALGIPVVDVAGAYTAAGFHQVNNDDYATGRLAGEYLVSRGFRLFAYCGVAEVGWSNRRKNGFVDAVENVCPEVAVFEESLPWWERLENSEHLLDWLSALELPTGVFACNDTAGVKLSEVCRKIGVAIPERVAVLGVDNEDILCELALPSLSSIELDCESIGFRAASLLSDLLDGGARPVPSELLVPPKSVVERQSTDVFTCGDAVVEQAVRYIRAHAAEGIQVSDVVGCVASSRRGLEKRFRREVGRTLHDELVRVRIEHAKTLLRATDLTMAHVAEESGFGTLQRFHEWFRRAEGCSPGVFRKRGRGA